jgi:AcrR family transcriptional regulator
MSQNENASRGAPHVVELGSRSEPTRVAILESALRLFSRIGFEATSTRMIATEAGVHHASLRYHFAGKEELWRVAIRLMFDRQREEFREQQAENPIDPSTLDGMKEMVRRWVRYCAQHPEHAQILVHEAIADTPRLDWAVQEFVKANTLRFRQGFESHADDLRVPDPVLCSIILSSSSQMTFVLSRHLRRVFDVDVTRDVFVERLADSLIAMIFTR